MSIIVKFILKQLGTNLMEGSRTQHHGVIKRKRAESVRQYKDDRSDWLSVRCSYNKNDLSYLSIREME